MRLRSSVPGSCASWSAEQGGSAKPSKSSWMSASCATSQSPASSSQPTPTNSALSPRHSTPVSPSSPIPTAGCLSHGVSSGLSPAAQGGPSSPPSSGTSSAASSTNTAPATPRAASRRPGSQRSSASRSGPSRSSASTSWLLAGSSPRKPPSAPSTSTDSGLLSTSHGIVSPRPRRHSASRPPKSAPRQGRGLRNHHPRQLTSPLNQNPHPLRPKPRPKRSPLIGPI